MTANIPRTASRALANAALPYLVELADRGLDAGAARRSRPGRGPVLYRGKIVNERVGKSLDIQATPLDRLLLEGGSRHELARRLQVASCRRAARGGADDQERGPRLLRRQRRHPQALVRALAERQDELQNVQLNHVLLIGEDPLSAPGMEGHFRHNSLFVGPADRKAVNDGRADYVPIFLHQIPRLFSDGIVPLDVAMVMVSPPDEHGFMSLGVEILASKAACRAAKYGHRPGQREDAARAGRLLPARQPGRRDRRAHRALPTLQAKPATDVEKAIGDHIVALIEPGATIQMGIGGIPDAVYAAMDGPLDLGIHTEMISDGAMRAIERGVVTGNQKTLHPGKVVITFALGSRDALRVPRQQPVHRGPPGRVRQRPGGGQPERQPGGDQLGDRDRSHRPGLLRLDRPRHLLRLRRPGGLHPRGGPLEGRQADHRPPVDGARGGAMSRIVPFLKQGAGVVTSRADVHYVVTEHGVANLFGKNLRERAEALIGIADPEFQDELEAAAKERKLLP